MGKRGVVLLSSALVAAGCLIGVSGVMAKPHKPHHYSTTVSIDGVSSHYFGTSRDSANARGTLQGYDFYGHLQSSKRKCYQAGRRIDVAFVREGPDKKLGFDLSDSNGGWSVFDRDPNLVAGTYLAKLKSKKVGGDICKGDTSSFTISHPRP